jgi:hypothetical protein
MTGPNAAFPAARSSRRVLTTLGIAAAVLAASLGGSAGVSAAVPSAPDTQAAAVLDSTVVSEPAADRVRVYYFHRTIRCGNCLKFEAYAHEALSSRFPEELGDGRLVWTVLDFEDETNAELVDYYDIFESSLVISEIASGEESDWQKLEAIWWLVYDKPAFLDYVAAEVDSALNDVAAHATEPPRGGRGAVSGG